MVGELECIGHLLLARRAGGEPVELVRSPEELVFLAFDSHIKRLVELHVLRSGKTLDSVAKKSAFDRAQQASTIRGPSFMRILEVGEDQGLVYYTSNLNDGEFVADYTLRRGQLPPATVFSLVFQLLDDLLQLKDCDRLIAHMRLDRVVVSTLEDTFLQLRIYDYGLSSLEPDIGENGGGPALVVQACELLFLMLTGKPFSGDNPDRYAAITALPMNLRTTMRAALTDPANAPTTIIKVRDDVREAFGSLVSSIQARNSRKHLVVTPAVQPRSQLQDLLLENVPVEIILGNRFRAEDPDQVRRHPFSIPCINAKNEQNVTVHLLPPSRIVDKTQYEAVPLQMWRFNAERHPNILRSLSLWESPDWTFLTEEREPGFTLSRLLAERICLNPAEVSVLLRQVRAGIEQALECGVQRVDLHPSNIVLRVGKAGPLLMREYERLMQKRIDAWPKFLVKLRAHLTMRNLYEPLLVDKPEQGEHEESHLADRDYRHRAFVFLCAYLLTGERQNGGVPHFPEAVPEPLAAFVRENMELTRQVGHTPNPNEFLDQFEAVMNGPAVPNLATRLRGAKVAIEEMESAGSVSDFDEEWAAPARDFNDLEEPSGPVARSLNVSHFNTPRQEGFGWPAWTAATVVVTGLLGWWLVPKNSPPAPLLTDIPTAPVVTATVDSTPSKDAKAPDVKIAQKPSAPQPVKAQKKSDVIPTVAAARPATPPGPATMAIKPELAGKDLAKAENLPPTPPVFASVPQLSKPQDSDGPEASTASAPPPQPAPMVAVTEIPAPKMESPVPPALLPQPTVKPALPVIATQIPQPPAAPMIAESPKAPEVATMAPIPQISTPPAAPVIAAAPAVTPAPPVSPPPAAALIVAAPKPPTAPAAPVPEIITAQLPVLTPVTLSPLPTLSLSPQVSPGGAFRSGPPAAIPPRSLGMPKPVIASTEKPSLTASDIDSPRVPEDKAPAAADTPPSANKLTTPAVAQPAKVIVATPSTVAAAIPKPAAAPTAAPSPSPAPQTAPAEVIVRKAILPSAEEIARYKAAQSQGQSGIDTAQTKR